MKKKTVVLSDGKVSLQLDNTRETVFATCHVKLDVSALDEDTIKKYSPIHAPAEEVLVALYPKQREPGYWLSFSRHTPPSYEAYLRQHLYADIVDAALAEEVA